MLTATMPKRTLLELAGCLVGEWRVFNPYQFLLDEKQKIAYPLNRLYKNLGNGEYCRSIAFPHHDVTVYMYNDANNPNPDRSTRRPELLKRQAEYRAKLADIENRYTIQEVWDTTIKRETVPQAKFVLSDADIDAILAEL